MFIIYCDNKGCGKEQEPLLNTSTDEVECSECGKVINNVTSFTKIQMKSMGQIKRAKKVQQAFAHACIKCNHTAQPKLVNDKLLCAGCGYEFIFNKIYTNSIKEFIKKPAK